MQYDNLPDPAQGSQIGLYRSNGPNLCATIHLISGSCLGDVLRVQLFSSFINCLLSFLSLAVRFVPCLRAADYFQFVQSRDNVSFLRDGNSHIGNNCTFRPLSILFESIGIGLKKSLCICLKKKISQKNVSVSVSKNFV